ncbi:MAG: accessory gene regulator B family protein [Syntrophomonas sp.]
MNSRSIKKVSYAIARYISTKMNENHTDKYIYYYALQVIIGTIIEAVFIYSVAWLMGILAEALLSSVVFATIRRYAGGFHQDTYTKCFWTTSILILSIALLARYSYYHYTALINSVLFIASIYLTYLYAPCDTINKPITSFEHRIELRNKALALNIFWLSLSFSFIIYAPVYAPTVGWGAFVQALSITPIIADLSPLRKKISSANSI